MSEYFVWTSDLNTNIRIIDEQHKKIGDFINALHRIKRSRNKQEIAQVIEELVDYTISHFAYEEALMEQASYPFIKPHQRVHQLFIDKINAYVKRFYAGEDITDELSSMLKRWLVSHIKNEDNDYVKSVFAQQDTLHHNVKKGLFSKIAQALF